MKTLYELFGGKKPPAEELIHCVPLELAYLCMDCNWIVEDTNNMRCRKCNSEAIFRVRDVLNAVKNRAASRFKKPDHDPVV